MLSTAIVIFREMLEIAMILSIVLASTRGLPRRAGWIAAGFAMGIFGAGLVALFTGSISSALSGAGQELFNAAILFAAAITIGWTVLWMRRHAREMSAHFKQIGHDVSIGTLPLYSLSVIIGLAMLREGSEIVLFMYGMLLSGQNTLSIISGSAIGLVLGIIAGVMVYYGILKIPARYTLKVTSWLLILLVAGLTSQGAGYLSAAGYFSDISQPLWDTSWLLDESSIAGKTLHTLIGYSAQPSPLQLAFYLGTLFLITAIIVLGNKRSLRNHFAVSILIPSCVIFYHSPVFALDHFYAPTVNKGELEIEYVGSRTFDHNGPKNNIRGDGVEFEYGVTDHWKTIVAGAFAKPAGTSHKMEAAEIESVFQFTEQGAYWVDTGALAAYHIATQSHSPDAVEFKLLLQKDMGQFTHLANIGVEQTLGRYSGGTGGPEYSVLWNTRYRYNDYIQPGFEIQSTLGQGPTLGKYDEQEHYIGPSAYGRLIGNLKYEAAYLFGASKVASQGAGRLLLEYEVFF